MFRIRNLVVACTAAITLCLATALPGQALPEAAVQAAEQRLGKQLDSLMLMIKIATGTISIVGLALAAWGVANYRSLLTDIRAKYSEQLNAMRDDAARLSENLAKSEAVLREAQEALGLNRSAIGAVVLAQAADCLTGDRPDSTKALSLLAQLARDDAASPDELYSAALMAKQQLSSAALAKRLAGIAVRKPNAPARARALNAELCADDPDSAQHEAAIAVLLKEFPYNESYIKSAGNYYTRREDWQGLENTMRIAAERAPWLSTPHRSRALAARRLRRNHDDIVRFYESSVECCVSSNDDQALTWYADYLYNNGSPRAPADLEKAADLLWRAYKMDPSDGNIMVELGQVLNAQRQSAAANRMLLVGMKFAPDQRARRKALALLKMMELESDGNGRNGGVAVPSGATLPSGLAAAVLGSTLSVGSENGPVSNRGDG